MTPDPIPTLITLAHEAATEPDRVKRREVLTRMGALLQVAVDAEEDGSPTNCPAHKPRA